MTDDLYLQRKNALRNFYKKYKRIPSYEEIAALFKVSSKGSIYKYVEKFISDGILDKSPNGALIATKKLLGIPLLGEIKAGVPNAQEQRKAKIISLDDYLISDPSSSFILTVDGDSMIDAGIMEGDMVIIDRKRISKPGDIVVAQVDNEWTLKFIGRKSGKVFLRAGNEKYKDIYPRTELKIAGVVTSVIRKY